MARRKNIPPPNPQDYIKCPLNLDGIIMAPTTTPDVVELNCALDDGLLFDAIRLCSCSYWMFKLDVLGQFSFDFRTRLFSCLPALPSITRQYFSYQLENSCHNVLRDEFHRFMILAGFAQSSNLNNPLNMLGNDIKELDLKVLNGEMTPRELLLRRIQEFLDTKDRKKIDFSYSLFLPEFLNPKFFKDASEAEHIVLLGNLGKYFEFLTKFIKPWIKIHHTPTQRIELFPPQLLIKHILADADGTYTNRVKMMAWKQLYDEAERLCVNNHGAYKLFDDDKLKEQFDETWAKMEQKEVKGKDIEGWMTNSEGVFESFELDCTLHGIDATDYLPQILVDWRFYKLAKGLVDFQDDETRNHLFKVVASIMSEFR